MTFKRYSAFVLAVALSAVSCAGPRLAALSDVPGPADSLATADSLSRDSFEPSTTFATYDDSTSYALGVNVGSGLREQLLTVSDFRAFATGVKDAMESDSSGLRIHPQSIGLLLTVLQQEVQTRQAERLAKLQEDNLAEAKAFLDENAKREGVVTTESGLQYRVVREGEGGRPNGASTVVVHYTGRFIDGSEFDSSHRRGQPATFPVNGVIRGWTEGLQLMPVGSTYELVVPPDLAYGVNGNQRIPPNTLLIFEVELLEIK